MQTLVVRRLHYTPSPTLRVDGLAEADMVLRLGVRPSILNTKRHPMTRPDRGRLRIGCVLVRTTYCHSPAKTSEGSLRNRSKDHDRSRPGSEIDSHALAIELGRLIEVRYGNQRKALRPWRSIVSA